MSTPETEQGVGTMTASLKRAYLAWRKRMWWSLGIWGMFGTVVGLGTWFAQSPIDRDSIMFGGVSALGLGVFLAGSMLTRAVLRKPETNCPQCGYDWQGSEASDDWLTWECCPHCGLKMDDCTEAHEKP